MTTPLIIMGTGGNCVDVLETAQDLNEAKGRQVYEPLGFLDDKEELQGSNFHGLPVLGPLAAAARYKDAKFIFAIGSPFNFFRREEILAKLDIPIERFATLVHPTAYCSRSARLGHGTVLLQNVTVASDAVIGSHVLILPQTVISHGDRIGDFCLIAGGVSISGDVRIGRLCYIGTSTAIRGNVKIDERVMIGMGSVVLNDVASNQVLVGNPAKKLRDLQTT